MKATLRQLAVVLRTQQHLSYSAIRRRLGVSKSTLSYWLREFPLSREQILELRRQGWQSGEASRERFRTTMREQQERKSKIVYERYARRFQDLPPVAHFVAGLMLYAAEGGKRNSTRLALANTDPRIIRCFLGWLEQFLGIDRRFVRFQFHLYENMDITAEVAFWVRALAVSPAQIYKPSVRPLPVQGYTYQGPHRHGTCCLYAFGVEHHRTVTMAVQALLERLDMGA